MNPQTKYSFVTNWAAKLKALLIAGTDLETAIFALALYIENSLTGSEAWIEELNALWEEWLGKLVANLKEVLA